MIQRRVAHAVLVFDKFHIVSHLMQAVDQVRRDEIRKKSLTFPGRHSLKRQLVRKSPSRSRDRQLGLEVRRLAREAHRTGQRVLGLIRFGGRFSYAV